MNPLDGGSASRDVSREVGCHWAMSEVLRYKDPFFEDRNLAMDHFEKSCVVFTTNVRCVGSGIKAEDAWLTAKTPFGFS